MTKRVDILEQLQCMVNTETPTPLKVVNSMLDLIPESVWLDDNAKILCPACKDGIFLREAVVRILRAKFKQLPDDKNAVYDFTMRQEGILHQILKERIFGIAVSYRGYRVTKRTLYTCNPAFADIDNIFFDESLGKYVKDKSGAQIEKQCFHFIENIDEVSKFFEGKGVKDMQFDVIIGNPPYQLTVGGGNGANAVPIYQNFIEQAIKTNPEYLCMIVPSKWFNGGRGLDGFRDSMINSTNISKIHDYRNSAECFPNVGIQGGVNYFLWECNKKDNACEFYEHNGGKVTMLNRPLKNNFSSGIIRYNDAIPIVDKIRTKKENGFADLVSSQTPFGILSNFNNYSAKKEPGDVLYIKRKVKGDADALYVGRKYITKHKEWVDKYKIYFSLNYGAGMSGDGPYQVTPRFFVGIPESCCSQSYLTIGNIDSEEICNNIISYAHTKFFRFLVMLCIAGQTFSPNTFTLVPIQDFKENWTDEKLYKKYNLTNEEIAFIESMIRPMDINADENTIDTNTDDE